MCSKLAHSGGNSTFKKTGSNYGQGVQSWNTGDYVCIYSLCGTVYFRNIRVDLQTNLLTWSLKFSTNKQALNCDNIEPYI